MLMMVMVLFNDSKLFMSKNQNEYDDNTNDYNEQTARSPTLGITDGVYETDFGIIFDVIIDCQVTNGLFLIIFIVVFNVEPLFDSC